MRLIEIGLDAVLVEVEAAHTLQLADAARRAGWACDVVPGAQSVLLDGVRDRPGALAWLSAWQPQDREAGTELVEIAVRYDGPDLAAVATAWGCRPEQVAERHAAILWEAAFAGFAPGFAYLRPAGGELALPEVPRRRSPRPRVEPGSVAVASAWTGIYPTASPGGWQLIGSTDAVLWSLERPAPSLLPPGTRVRFVVR
ncbi:carboxyltransferase domain-containing protein [Nocardioides dubius]|uniref:Allophanate hydrolase subunit 1 n=1 Tax=Nocardioides dubius TaxID=317019 RepID=A0ABN1TRL2_9ACTN